MDIFEVRQSERPSREDVAPLRNLADMLARHNDVEPERGGMRVTVHVPDEIELKIELEVESDERELEIELTGDTRARPGNRRAPVPPGTPPRRAKDPSGRQRGAQPGALGQESAVVAGVGGQ